MSYRPSPLVRLRGLLAADGQLAVALPEAQRLAELNLRFAGVVPPAVAKACHVASVQAETAVVFCANGAAASRVRAQAKALASALSGRNAPVNALKVKVRADWARTERPEKFDLPPQALHAFRALDEALPEGGLKEAVERMLRRRGG
ncbi:MAG: DUF721 domain-containing protein [Betaproteobacteria bacterium]|nr:DUF721 domain-containing protein [Betaproteobacteria bacterium]